MSQKLLLCALLCLGALAVEAKGKSPSDSFMCPRTGPNNTFVLDPLSLPYDGYMPLANNQTMYLHTTKHHQTYINNLNAITVRYPVLAQYSLSDLVAKVGEKRFVKATKLAANDTFFLRNNAGGHYNHAMFWKTLTTANASNPSTDLSAGFQAAINTAFGNVTNMVTAMKTAGTGVFGSGWAWLCYGSNSNLKVITTPNQDNPLMKKYVNAGCTPLLGIDVWEHAYYLTYLNVRASYLAAWPQNINWAQVERNYQFAKAGVPDAIWCATSPPS